jgi:hypothetical protein
MTTLSKSNLLNTQGLIYRINTFFALKKQRGGIKENEASENCLNGDQSPMR